MPFNRRKSPAIGTALAEAARLLLARRVALPSLGCSRSAP